MIQRFNFIIIERSELTSVFFTHLSYYLLYKLIIPIFNFGGFTIDLLFFFTFVGCFLLKMRDDDIYSFLFDVLHLNILLLLARLKDDRVLVWIIKLVTRLLRVCIIVIAPLLNLSVVETYIESYWLVVIIILKVASFTIGEWMSSELFILWVEVFLTTIVDRLLLSWVHWFVESLMVGSLLVHEGAIIRELMVSCRSVLILKGVALIRSWTLTVVLNLIAYLVVFDFEWVLFSAFKWQIHEGKSLWVHF